MISGLLNRKKTKLNSLKRSRASKIKQRSDEVSKKNKATEHIRRTKSAPTIRAKQREVQRREKNIVKYDKDISRLEKQISRIEQDISKEEGKQNKKREKEAQNTIKK